MRQGILRGVRGPRGGYELARDEGDIGADEILRAAGTVEEHNDVPVADSVLLTNVVVPALERAEEKLSEALARITANGNPAMKPLMSWNVDLSAEFYLNSDSLFSAGLFYKQFQGVRGATFAEVADRLARYGRWEFEDYQSLGTAEGRNGA